MEPTDKEIGVDLGLKDLAICSNGVKIPVLHSLRKELPKLKREQRKLSKMTQDSNNYKRQKLRIAKIHQHISNQRKDYLHKISCKLTNENQVIALEDLNVKGLMKNHHLALSISNVGWTEFVSMLELKRLIKAEPFRKLIDGFLVHKFVHVMESLRERSHCGLENGSVLFVVLSMTEI